MTAGRDMVVALFAAVLLHAAVVAALSMNLLFQSRPPTFVRPPIVPTTLVQIEATAPSVARPAAPAVIPPPAKPKPKPKPKPPPLVAPRRKAEPKKVDSVARPKAEEPPAPRKQARQQRRDDVLRSTFDDEIEQEARAIAAADAARNATELAESYAGRIRAALQSAWVRPPSARNGMRTVLRIRLVPTGEVVSVNVEESSSNAAFDRSAVRAVQRLGTLEVPKDARIFEDYFRSLRLTFQPEDLMR